MFFHNVLYHWFLTLVWLAATVFVAFHFARKVSCSHWFQRMYHPVQHSKQPWLRILFGCVVILAFIAVTIAALPMVLVGLVISQYIEERRQMAEARERREQARIVKARNQKENEHRAEARKQWLCENRPKLYHNTVSGITAVLKPDAYERAVKQTKAARCNGFWEWDNVLCPAPDTIIFVTKQGKQLMDKSLSGDAFVYYRMAGWMSQLEEIIERCFTQGVPVEWIRAGDIFVPWANETIMAFVQQRQLFENCHARGNYFELIESQAPSELMPLV